MSEPALRTGLATGLAQSVLLLSALAGAGLAAPWGPRSVVRVGLVTILLATLAVLVVAGLALAAQAVTSRLPRRVGEITDGDGRD